MHLTYLSESGPLVRWLALLLLAISGVLASGGMQPTRAQGQRLVVHSDSQFWIQGEATTNDFTCRVGQVDGRAKLPAPKKVLASSSEKREPTVIVKVAVGAFDCGNRIMTKDLKETLKVEEYPHIRFELIDARVGTPIDTTAEWRPVKVLGALTVAGTKRVTTLSALGRALDESRFRIRGCHSIRMTDFEIEPPTKAFGLIKVKDQIEVQFDLLAHTAEREQKAPFEALTIAGAPSCPVVERGL